MKTKLITAILLISIFLNNNANSQIKFSSNNFGMKAERAIKSHTYCKRTVIQKNDSIYTWYMDTFSIGWKKWKNEIKIDYDSNSNIIGYITQTFDNNHDWVNHYKYIYTFDSNNNQTSSLIQMWDGKLWINSSKDTSINTYDANNNKTSTISLNWYNDKYVNSSRIIYKYDFKNNLIYTLNQQWNIDDWFNYHLDSANYDFSNNMISAVGFNWENFKWLPSYKIINTYDGNNNKISEIMYSCDPDSGFLVCNTKDNNTYDANNNLIYLIEQNWNGNNWENSFKEYYTYDANNNQTVSIHQNWQDNSWINVLESAFTYDVNNFIKSETYKFLDSTGVFGGDSTYYYFNTNGINDYNIQVTSILIYPNPNTGLFTINSYNAISSIEVYNLTGELLYSNYNLKRQTSVDIDLSDLQKGIYFARIQDGKHVMTEKLIIQ